MQNIKGVFTAIVTPFDDDGKLDEEGLRYNLKHQLTHGVDGIVALGTTGESSTLTEQEKIRVIEISKEMTNGKIPLMVGTGNYSTQQTIHDTRRAEKLGADIALIVTPYYIKPTQKGILEHFRSVATSINIPIVIYNIPCRCGSNIEVSTMRCLAEIPNIVGVKEASGSLIQISEMSDDAFTLPVLALGGQGIISVASNLIPKEMKALTNALFQGDYSTARKHHYHLFPLFRALFLETNPIPIKTAMKFCGMPAKLCRLPLCELRPENAIKLKNVLHQLHLIPEFVTATHD